MGQCRFKIFISLLSFITTALFIVFLHIVEEPRRSGPILENMHLRQHFDMKWSLLKKGEKHEMQNQNSKTQLRTIQRDLIFKGRTYSCLPNNLYEQKLAAKKKFKVKFNKEKYIWKTKRIEPSRQYHHHHHQKEKRKQEEIGCCKNWTLEIEFLLQLVVIHPSDFEPKKLIFFKAILMKKHSSSLQIIVAKVPTIFHRQHQLQLHRPGITVTEHNEIKCGFVFLLLLLLLLFCKSQNFKKNLVVGAKLSKRTWIRKQRRGRENMGIVIFVLFFFLLLYFLLSFENPPFEGLSCPIMEKKKTINVERGLWVCVRRWRRYWKGFPL